jgi:hypothetical protein
VNLLRADVKRQRVVFFLNRQPTSDAEIDGLWECRAQGTPKRLSPMDVWPGTGQRVGAGLGDWAGAVRGDQWLMASDNGALEVDLTTLGVRRLWQVEPVATAPPLDASFFLRAPLAMSGDWLYTANLCRARLDGSAYDQFPLPRPMDLKNHAYSFKFVDVSQDGSKLIMADNCGLWVAQLRKAARTR